MRVAVTHEDGSVSAYRLGRIEDLPNPLTGQTTPAVEVAAQLFDQARVEFPGAEVRIQRLVSNEDADENGENATSRWIDAEELREDHVSPEGHLVVARELAMQQAQQASQEGS